jgi:hypothetical protein
MIKAEVNNEGMFYYFFLRHNPEISNHAYQRNQQLRHKWNGKNHSPPLIGRGRAFTRVLRLSLPTFSKYSAGNAQYRQR